MASTSSSFVNPEPTQSVSVSFAVQPHNYIQAKGKFKKPFVLLCSGSTLAETVKTYFSIVDANTGKTYHRFPEGYGFQLCGSEHLLCATDLTLEGASGGTTVQLAATVKSDGKVLETLKSDNINVYNTLGDIPQESRNARCKSLSLLENFKLSYTNNI
jgi:hypothetical protein